MHFVYAYRGVSRNFNWGRRSTNDCKNCGGAWVPTHRQTPSLYKKITAGDGSGPVSISAKIRELNARSPKSPPPPHKIYPDHFHTYIVSKNLIVLSYFLFAVLFWTLVCCVLFLSCSPQLLWATDIEEGDTSPRAILFQAWGSIWGSAGFSRYKNNRGSSGA